VRTLPISCCPVIRWYVRKHFARELKEVVKRRVILLESIRSHIGKKNARSKEIVKKWTANVYIRGRPKKKDNVEERKTQVLEPLVRIC